MIEQRARVVGTDGGFAVVEAAPSGGCSSCGVQGGCGVSRLGKLLPQRRHLLRVPNACGARAGDEVTLGLPDDALLRSALAAYLPPLAGLLAGALIAGGLSSGDLWPMLGAACGLLLGLAAARGMERWRGAAHVPQMLARRSATAGLSPVTWQHAATRPNRKSSEREIP